jgi:hypothetical protein
MKSLGNRTTAWWLLQILIVTHCTAGSWLWFETGRLPSAGGLCNGPWVFQLSSYVASAGTLCRVALACPCRMPSRCGLLLGCWTFVINRGIQLNTAQGIDLWNYGGFTMMVLVSAVYPPLHLVQPSTDTNCISNFQNIASRLHWVTSVSNHVGFMFHVPYSSLLNLWRFWACCWTTAMMPSAVCLVCLLLFLFARASLYGTYFAF